MDEDQRKLALANLVDVMKQLGGEIAPIEELLAPPFVVTEEDVNMLRAMKISI